MNCNNCQHSEVCKWKDILENVNPEELAKKIGKSLGIAPQTLRVSCSKWESKSSYIYSACTTTVPQNYELSV